MTEDDRMDRAKRIRRMREGKRVGADETDETDSEDPEGGGADAGAGSATEGSSDGTATEDTPDGTATEDTPDGTATEDTPDGTTDDARQPGTVTGPDTGPSSAEATGDPETATTDGGSAAGGTVVEEDDGEATDGDADPDGATQGTGAPDPEVSSALDTVSDSTASVPSAEEMAAALEVDPAQAGEQDDSDAARTVAEDSAARGESADGADDAAEASPPETGPAGIDAGASTAAEETTRVLEFTLADEYYCLDIRYIEEIVKQETITRVPNTPAFVEGVVDLRGQITTILNPKVTIGKDDQTPGDLIVVFDGEAFEDQGYIGWIVDDVRQVSPVTDDQVNDPPMGEDYINGVIDREDDDQFVIWTTPDLALDDGD
jgi:purine-binding chemotaxis protein CheW